MERINYYIGHVKKKQKRRSKMRFYKLFNTKEAQKSWLKEMKENKDFKVCFHTTPQKEGLKCEQKFMTVYCFKVKSGLYE